jgi:RNA recognition motif-containing protein
LIRRFRTSAGDGCHVNSAFLSTNFYLMNIFIAKLSFDTKDDDLQDHFAEYGTVTSARVVTDKHSGRSKGFGFVEIEDDGDAQKAIDELDGTELQGRTIVVKKAEPRKENDRPPRRY